MKRIAAVGLALLLLLTGCAPAGIPSHTPTGDGLTWDDATTPPQTQGQEQALEMVYYPDRSMNPLESRDYTNRALFSLIYQGLFAVDADYNPVPILCQRYTVTGDMRSYTFYIANASFSDGTPLTPQDVYDSLDAAMDSPVYGGRFLHVNRMTLEEDGGITLRMDTPFENLPMLLDVPILKSGETDAEAPLGTGPYFLEQTNAGARLRRRTNWWCNANLEITASSIPLQAAQSAVQIRDAFEFSSVGLVCANPCSDDYADYRSDYELWDCENGGFLFLAANTDGPVFSNSALRSALTYAIDREAIAAEYYRGYARAAALPASPQSPFYNAALAGRYAYNPQKFSQAVEDAELPEDTPVRLLANKEDTLRLRVARRIQQMLQDCGMVVEFRECSQKDYFKALKNGDYDLYLGQTRLSANMDLSTFFSSRGNITYGGMTDPVIYALCLESLANRGNFYNLHAAIAEDGRLVSILFQSYAVYATRGLVSGLTPSRDNVFFYTLGRTMEDALAE